MSELSSEEQRYALHVAYSRLVPGGRIVIADETLPQGGFRSHRSSLASAPRGRGDVPV